MALSCPRCGTDVPAAAIYCPYCTLPKPKRGFVAPQVTTPEQPLKSPKPAVPARKASPRPETKQAKNPDGSASKRPVQGRANSSRKRGIRVLSIGAIVALLGVGVYIFVVPMVYSGQPEPKAVLAALDNLRKSPSNEPGVTIDARLTRELETQRRVGNLVAYQGWVVRPIKGSKTRIILAFSYQEVGDVHQNAEWIADLSTGTLTPQTELAVSVSSR